MIPTSRLKPFVGIARLSILATMMSVTQVPIWAASFTSSIFATGAGVSATSPDSVTYGNGSLWVEYSNGAPSSNYTGASTIVQYSLAGAVQNTYSITGNVDGLKFNPNTGVVWALQNQDGNSQLSIINPATKAISTFTYPVPVSASRGFDDVAFLGNRVFLSQTNPTSTSDAVVVQLNNSTPATPLSFSTVLTGAGLLATDPDSLKSTLNGGLILTGEGDKALTFITNPGTASQTASSIKLSGVGGTSIGNPDDSLYATADSGVFYVTDSTTNIVYAISASGLTPGQSLFVNVGNAFGSVDPMTGVVTPLVTGTGLHGAEFVAVPEPASAGLGIAGVVLLGFLARRKLIRADLSTSLPVQPFGRVHV